ncbi:hypothetical protein IWZ01DRAFT_241531 [Phyllosticta capitalensis]
MVTAGWQAPRWWTNAIGNWWDGWLEGGGIAWMAMDWCVFFFVFRCIDLLCFTFLKSCPGACLLACLLYLVPCPRSPFFFSGCVVSHICGSSQLIVIAEGAGVRTGC